MGQTHDIWLNETCGHCLNAKYRVPEDEHPSYVVCPSCNAIMLTYIPMEHQEVFHSTPYIVNEFGGINLQILGVLGGYGSAKSRASLEEFFLRCLENPNGTGAIMAQTMPQLKKTSIKTLLEEIIPPPLIKSFNKQELDIVLINDFRIYAIPTDNDEKIRSLNLGLIHMEEASGIKESIYAQCLTRLRCPFTKNRAIIICSNPEQSWLKPVLVDNDKKQDPRHPNHEDYNENITCYIWETSLNNHLPADFIENISKGRPDWWKRKYLYGSFEMSDAAVYPNFSQCVIDPYPIVKDKTDRFGVPLEWERVIGMDWGKRNETAVMFGAINPKEGELVIYNEYYQPNMLLPDHAERLKPLISEIPFGSLRFMVADPSIGNKIDVVKGKSVQGLFQEYGMFFSLGNNNIESGILKVNSFIERGKLKVYHTCVNLIKEAYNYKYEELDIDSINENFNEKPIKAKDHAMDSLRYLCMRLPDDIELLKTDSFNPPTRYSAPKNTTEAENEFGWIEDGKHEFSATFW